MVLPDGQVLCHLHSVDQVGQVAVVDVTAQVAGEVHLHIPPKRFHKDQVTRGLMAPFLQNWYHYNLKPV